MSFIAAKQPVKNRGCAIDDFLKTVFDVVWDLPDEIFAERLDPPAPNIDIYTKVRAALGDMRGQPIPKRRAFMCEVLRVLGGFESSWNWSEGHDTTNPSENNPETMSAGLWQISYNSRLFGDDLLTMLAKFGIHTGIEFQVVMKANHPFAIEYTARLLRHTDRHNGPVHRHEIDPYLSKGAMAEFDFTGDVQPA